MDMISEALPLPTVSLEETVSYLNAPQNFLLDALPYIDPITTEYDSEVKNLIDEQMKQIFFENGNKIPDYLGDTLPPISLPRFEDPESLTSIELRRIERNEPIQKLEMNHYISAIEAPSGQQLGQTNEWEDRINSSLSLLEHSHTSLLNLELMNRFAQTSWKPIIQQCIDIKNRLEYHIKEVKSKTEEVNKKRKLEQVECANELRQLDIEKNDFIKRNEAILPSLVSLESEVNFLKRMCVESDILPEPYWDDDLDIDD